LCAAKSAGSKTFGPGASVDRDLPSANVWTDLDFINGKFGSCPAGKQLNRWTWSTWDLTTVATNVRKLTWNDATDLTSACVDCPAKYFKPEAGSGPCRPCPAHMSTPPSTLGLKFAEECVLCPDGMQRGNYMDPKIVTTVPNPTIGADGLASNQWNIPASDTENTADPKMCAAKCPAGTQISKDYLKVLATPAVSEYSKIAKIGIVNAACEACPEGTFNSVEGGICKPCDPGTYMSFTDYYTKGQSESTKCAGKCPAGSSTHREAGQVSGSGVSIAEYGFGNKFVRLNNLENCAKYGGNAAECCKPCPAGYFSPEAGGLCKLAPPSTAVTSEGSSALTQCAVPDLLADLGATTCKITPESGPMSSSWVKFDVPAGKYKTVPLFDLSGKLLSSFTNVAYEEQCILRCERFPSDPADSACDAYVFDQHRQTCKLFNKVVSLTPNSDKTSGMVGSVYVA